MSTPQTVIYICSNVGLNSRYEHTIHFANASEQFEYFKGKVAKTYTAYSYTRRSWSLQVKASMSDALSWDYLFYKNVQDAKRLFYFINRVEYINDNTVQLELELDVIQTFFFDFELLPCFVERQHTVSDDIGEHLVDEGLDVGEYVSIDRFEHPDLNELCVLTMSTLDITLESLPAIRASRYNGIFGGLGIFATDMKNWQGLGEKLKLLENAGKSDAIVTMWMYPKGLIDAEFDTEINYVCLPIQGTNKLTKLFTRPSKIKDTTGAWSDFTPRNNKLLTYPYTFLYVTNNSGTAATFRYEHSNAVDDSGNRAINLEFTGAISPDGAIRVNPSKNTYTGYGGYEEGITLGGFPTCALNVDAYKIWLAQNQNQMNAQGVGSVLSIIGGVAMIATGAGATVGGGMIAGGLASIAGQISQNKDRQVQPPQAKGSHSAPVNVVNEMMNFSVMNKQVTVERARIIDDYFTMYGYKLNRVQIPNLKARPAFTYVKTVGCHIKAGFNNEDATKIESIFNNGITFWVNGNRIGDYTQDNKAT